MLCLVAASSSRLSSHLVVVNCCLACGSQRLLWYAVQISLVFVSLNQLGLPSSLLPPFILPSSSLLFTLDHQHTQPQHQHQTLYALRHPSSFILYSIIVLLPSLICHSLYLDQTFVIMSKAEPADQVKFLVSCIGHTSNGRVCHKSSRTSMSDTDSLSLTFRLSPMSLASSARPLRKYMLSLASTTDADL